MGKFIIVVAFIALCLFAYTRINNIPKNRSTEGELAEITAKEKDV